jgi:hypothetical protein
MQKAKMDVFGNEYGKLSPNACHTFLENGAFGETALDELNILWD